MLNLLKIIIFECAAMGLGITRASLVSAVCDDTGDDSSDAAIKVRRLINRRGSQFCNLAPWPFLRTQINFSITSAGGYSYSGSAYIPATYKRVISAFIVDNDRWYPIDEVGVIERDDNDNPNENEGRPEKFCISRVDSDKTYYQIDFDRKPDQTYTVYLEIEQQWADLTGDSSETLITKQFYDAFTHFCVMGRLKQQGDSENYAMYQNEWDGGNPISPAPKSILGTILSQLSSASKNKRVVVKQGYSQPFRDNDYSKGGAD